MEYRQLGRTGLEVGVIGLGTEHLLRQRETMDEVLRTAVEAGVNYVDLLYIEATGSDADFWDNFGPVLRPHRHQLVLAAHWGSGGARYELDYCQRCFEEVLACLGNDYADVAILTMVDEQKKWDGWAQKSIEHLRRYQERGHLGYIGLSGHEVPIALQAVNSGLIDVLMFGINMLRHGEEEKALIQACVDRGVGLVVMKPYFGGTLLFVDGQPTPITPVQCLAYVLSLPVSTTVPGVKNAAEMRATLRYCQATEAEKDYRPALANVHEYLEGHCVYCNHCLPCPQDINIATTILSTDWAQGGLNDELRAAYASLPVKASACTECGDCLARCPFDVDVIARMHQAVEVFEASIAEQRISHE